MRLGAPTRPYPGRLASEELRKTGACLVAVSMLYLALASFYSLRTPAWESNDEASHMQYVTYLRVHHAFPPIASGNGIEVHQAPAYYVFVAAWGRLLGIPAFVPDVAQAPGATPRSPLQVSHDYTPSQEQQAHWLHILRFVSILLGLLVVAAGFAIALTVTGSLACATAVGATIALWPRFLVITSTLNNDSLAYAACAAGTAFTLQSVRSRRAIWPVAAGVSLAVAALTKQTTLPVVGTLMLVIIGFGVKRKLWRAPVLTVAIFAGGSSWWYIRNLVVHGDLLASGITNRYLSEALPALIRPHATLAPIGQEVRGRLLTSLWYGAGWNQIELPRGAGIVISLLAIAAVLGAVLRGQDVIESRGVLILCLGGGFVAWGLLVAQTTQNEGRYLFVAITALATLMVAGPAAVVRSRSPVALSIVYGFWPTVLVGLNIYVMATWLIPYGRL